MAGFKEKLAVKLSYHKKLNEKALQFDQSMKKVEKLIQEQRKAVGGKAKKASAGK